MKFTTERLLIRQLKLEDAEFIKKIVNQESWLQFIGDKNIHSISDAENYISSGPIKMYNEYGFGLWAVDLKSNNMTIGICGLIKRDNLPEIDLGFAFLDEYTHHGYAYEACNEVLNYAKNQLNKETILAIVMPENQRSIKLLHKLNFSYLKNIKTNPEACEINLMELKL